MPAQHLPPRRSRRAADGGGVAGGLRGCAAGHPAVNSAPAVGQPGVMNDEMDALLESLDTQREHVLGALDGLSDEDLRRPVLPSGWTPLGLVHHLTMDVERFWYRHAMAGDPWAGGDEDAWQVPDGMSAAEVLRLYRDEI